MIELPIGPKLYPVATLNLEQIHARRRETAILAASGGKPMTGEIAKASAAQIRALVAGDHPELTDAFIISWLSQALCTLVALEWQRQFFAVSQFPRA